MNLRKSRASSGPLSDSRFRVLWFGQTLSYAGSAIFPVALTLALVQEIGSATDLGLVLAGAAVGESLSLLVGGVWADRLPRQKVMMAADSIRCVAHTFIGLRIVGGHAGLPELILASSCVGAATGFFLPASSGLVPATVAPELLQRANAVMAVSRRSAMMLGPAAATTIALTIGPGWAMVIDGATFAVNVMMLSRLRVEHAATPREGFLKELREGWGEIRERTWLWSNFLAHGCWNLSRTVYFTVGAATVISGIGGEVAWGVIAQGATVGALTGALVSLRVRTSRPLVVINICLSLGAIPLALIALGAHTALIAVGAGVMAFALGLMGTLWDTAVQQQIPADRMSRVSAYEWLLSSALIPLGMALAGPLAMAVGAKAALYGAAALMAVSSLGVLAIPEVRRLGQTHGPAVAEEADPISAGV
ncbi:MFS transporter [Streptomyces musisoli]|uniref:MFS transporter n=1 Tax=Streptomyces musisoli TaxID=2802280 RepID=UPI001F3D16B1|nr:MFS transporter [Streptomyces musisoli]